MPKSNEYEHEFKVRCPVAHKEISYRLHITSENTLRYGDITKVCEVAIALHEDLADELKEVLGGDQTLTARHGDVWVRTKR